MPDPKSRARLQRLLTADFQRDDLSNLLLFARDHSDGRESVIDLGHFIAHHAERDKGIVTRSTRDWFSVARFHMSRFGPRGKPLDPQRLPPSTPDYFKIAVNRIGAQIIRNHARLRRGDAYKMMQNIADRITKNADGTWALPQHLTQTEMGLLQCISSVLNVPPAFTAERLSDDFLATLKSNGLITKEELKAHKHRLSLLVQLFAVSAMHNCIVQVGDGTTTQLKASANDRQIVVHAFVPEAIPGLPNVSVAAAIFFVDVDPAKYCHPDLLQRPDTYWDVEIELSRDERLAPIR